VATGVLDLVQVSCARRPAAPAPPPDQLHRGAGGVEGGRTNWVSSPIATPACSPRRWWATRRARRSTRTWPNSGESPAKCPRAVGAWSVRVTTSTATTMM